MKYVVTGFVLVKIEVDATSEKDALIEAASQFDLEEFVSYGKAEAQFKKAVIQEESDVEESDLIEDEDDEE
jgi:serine protease inhibitor ecotin